MPKIAANGTNLYYEMSGDGPPVVQLHNAGWGRLTFKRLTPLLARECTVIDYDMRGFGLSDKPVQTYSQELWADDCAALVRALGFEKVHLHGTANGGMISLNVAVRHPDLVDRIILNGSLAKYDTFDRIRRTVRGHIVRAYGIGEELLDFNCFTALSRIYLDSDRYPEAREYIRAMQSQLGPPEVDKEINKAMMGADHTALLPRVMHQTLVLGGRDSLLQTVDVGPSGAHSRVLAEKIPNAELKIIDGGSPLIEYPEQVRDAIVEFLTRDRAPAATAGA